MHYKPGYRKYFGFENNRVVILLCGGSKGTQQKDIGTARKYWNDYLQRGDACLEVNRTKITY